MECRHDALTLGVEEIDSEHRQLTSLLAEFVECLHTNATNEQTLAVLQKAIAFANSHIASEDALMDRTAYPSAEEHKLQHRNTRLQCTTLMSNTSAILAHDPEALRHFDTVRRLVFAHIDGPDRELAAYLKSRSYG